MIFEQGHIYHIYNQGNNRQKIFFNRDNYLFFLQKIKEHILPHGDIMAWCLMPNHFHIMVHVNKLEIEVQSTDPTHGATFSHPMSLQSPILQTNKTRTLNQSIAILLRSYTRAINKEQERSGALFREATKAECVTEFKGVMPSYFNTPSGAIMNTHYWEEDYPKICFDYIHNNPVAAKLVKHPEDWEFSSFNDYKGNRNGKLINKELTQKYVEW